MAIKKYYDSDCNLGVLDGKTVAVIGFGSQGHAHSENLAESGVNVVVGLRKGSAHWEKASEFAATHENFKVMEVEEAAKAGDVVMMLVPDELCADIYNKQVAPYMTEGKALAFAHGFNIHLLNDHLAAAAKLCPHKAARKAHGCGQHQRHGAACNALAIELFLLFRGLRVLRLYRMYRRRCTSRAVVCLRGGVSGLRFRLRVVVLVGGVHAAAAHIGVTGISAFVFILRGIIIFPFVLIVHADTSFP